MISKQQQQLKWMDIVFKNMERLELNIIRGIENQSFTEESLDKLQSDLQHHYGAISNLRKSFSSDTFFTGYFVENE
jgi:hypothetical protein